MPHLGRSSEHGSSAERTGGRRHRRVAGHRSRHHAHVARGGHARRRRLAPLVPGARRARRRARPRRPDGAGRARRGHRPRARDVRPPGRGRQQRGRARAREPAPPRRLPHPRRRGLARHLRAQPARDGAGLPGRAARTRGGRRRRDRQRLLGQRPPAVPVQRRVLGGQGGAHEPRPGAVGGVRTAGRAREHRLPRPGGHALVDPRRRRRRALRRDGRRHLGGGARPRSGRS